MELLDLNQSRSIDMNEYEFLDRCSKIMELCKKILEQHSTFSIQEYIVLYNLWNSRTNATIYEREFRSGIPGMIDNKFGMSDSNTDGVLDKAELGKYLVSLNKDADELDLDVSFNKFLYLFG